MHIMRYGHVEEERVCEVGDSLFKALLHGLGHLVGPIAFMGF